VEACVVKQLYHFAMGRPDGALDAPLLNALADGFKKKGRSFEEPAARPRVEPAFAYRRVED
jgi:hypothetical protein